MKEEETTTDSFIQIHQFKTLNSQVSWLMSHCSRFSPSTSWSSASTATAGMTSSGRWGDGDDGDDVDNDGDGYNDDDDDDDDNDDDDDDDDVGDAGDGEPRPQGLGGVPRVPDPGHRAPEHEGRSGKYFWSVRHIMF